MKAKKMFHIRLLVFGMLLAVCITQLAACKGDGEAEATGSGTPSGETNTGPEWLDDLPPLNFNETVNVLTWTEQAQWDWAEDTGLGDKISAAVFERQQSVMERLNIDFEVTKRDGAWANRESYVNTIRLSIENGSNGFDLIAAHSASAAAAAVQGYFMDLNQVEYINPTQRWWPDDIWDTCEINNHLYFITGDITATAIRSISCMILNLDMYNSLNFEESVYDIVERGDWTMENFMEVSVGSRGEQLDGNYAVTIGSNVEFDNLFYGAGFRYVEKDPSDGLLMLSDDIEDQRLDSWFTTVQSLFKDNADVSITPIDSAFTSGLSLWYMGYLSDVQEYLTDVTFSFAVTPYPKLDSTQEDYCTINGWWLTMYGVPGNATSTEMSGAVLEALGSEGLRIVTPAVYEEAFKYRYLQTEKNAIMFDILHDTLVFDAGRIFCDQLEKIGYAFRQAADPTQNWTTYRNTYGGAWERALRDVLRSFV